MRCALGRTPGPVAPAMNVFAPASSGTLLPEGGCFPYVPVALAHAPAAGGLRLDLRRRSVRGPVAQAGRRGRGTAFPKPIFPSTHLVAGIQSPNWEIGPPTARYRSVLCRHPRARRRGVPCARRAGRLPHRGRARPIRRRGRGSRRDDPTTLATAGSTRSTR